MIIFGHRGAPGYPRFGENTAVSFRKALEWSATGLEFDVRRCADGQLVVIHDETIDRTTNGRGCVANLTYDELSKFDAGFGSPIPRLADVLDEFGASAWTGSLPTFQRDVRRWYRRRGRHRRLRYSAGACRPRPFCCIDREASNSLSGNLSSQQPCHPLGIPRNSGYAQSRTGP